MCRVIAHKSFKCPKDSFSQKHPSDFGCLYQGEKMAGIRRNTGLSGKPWIAVAAVAGVLVVGVCAVMIFMGGFWGSTGLTVPGSDSGIPSSGQSGAGHAAASSGATGTLAYNVVMTSGHEIDDVVVPDEGVYLRVIYRGGYSGRWLSGNETGTVQNSGERIIAIENPGNTLIVDLKKQDTSSQQPLTLEIWKDGVKRAANSTSLAFGSVTTSTAL